MDAHAPVALVAYGSLMSGYGMRPLGDARVQAVGRVALLNARRGFAKYAQRGDRFAMALEPVDTSAPLATRPLAPSDPPGAAPEGILLRVAPADLPRIARREGYDERALAELRRQADRRDCSLAELLWTLLENAGFDVAGYRRALRDITGYTSPHYIPHPVTAPAGPALTFLAPGAEGSGDEHVVPVRVRTGNKPLMTAMQAWRERPNATQVAYFTACFLGALHGICQRDLVDDLAEDSDLARQLRDALGRERPRELPSFLAATGLDKRAYRTAFGESVALIERSGLSHLFEELHRGT